MARCLKNEAKYHRSSFHIYQRDGKFTFPLRCIQGVFRLRHSRYVKRAREIEENLFGKRYKILKDIKFRFKSNLFSIIQRFNISLRRESEDIERSRMLLA